MNYSDKLKHPRWQRKRLEVLNRDGFKCAQCGNAEVTLHVHHKRYDRNKEPWDYALTDLITLCDPCHQQAHGFVEIDEAEERAMFREHVIETVTRAFDASVDETRFLPYGMYTDAIMDLSALQLYYPNVVCSEKERLKCVIEYLTLKLTN
jgi:hypothetical protein